MSGAREEAVAVLEHAESGSLPGDGEQPSGFAEELDGAPAIAVVDDRRLDVAEHPRGRLLGEDIDAQLEGEREEVVERVVRWPDALTDGRAQRVAGNTEGERIEAAVVAPRLDH